MRRSPPAHPRHEAVQGVRVVDDQGPVERRAEHRRVRDLAAKPAADAGIDHLGDRLAPQRVRVRRDGERRAAREADAGMVAGAGVGIDPEALADDALAGFHRLRRQRALAALAVQHAFGLGDDDLRTFRRRRQRLLQRFARLGDVVGVAQRAHPADADAAHRLLDRVLGRADVVVRRRGEEVLAAGGGRVAVVDDDVYVVAAVEDGIADQDTRPLCQKPPSPMTAIARLSALALSAAAPAPPRP